MGLQDERRSDRNRTASRSIKAAYHGPIPPRKTATSKLCANVWPLSLVVNGYHVTMRLHTRGSRVLLQPICLPVCNEQKSYEQGATSGSQTPQILHGSRRLAHAVTDRSK
jgi:hypothetical protein